MANTEYYLNSLEHLLIVSQNLCSTRSLEEITKIVIAAARKIITGADGVTFILLDYGFAYYLDEDATTSLWKGQRLPLDTDIAGRAMINRKPCIIEDISEYTKDIKNIYEGTFVKSMAVIPIHKEEIIASIGIYWSYHYQATSEEVKLLELLADSTAVAMENIDIISQLEKQLRNRTTALEDTKILLQQEMQKSKAMEAEVYRLSLTDKLTGLHNRQGFLLLAEQQLRLGKRTKIQTKLMFFEIRNIPEIQSTFGDEMADEAIIAVSKLLKQSFRTSDTLGRFSENEFVVLVQGYNLSCDVIEARVETNIAKFNQTHYLPFPITLNIGIQYYDYNANISLDTLMKLAHVHVYER